MIKYIQGSIVSSAETILNEVPSAFELGSNYPNPFNPQTTIQYAIPGQTGGAVPVTLRIYNLQGQLVRTLVDEQKSPGRYHAIWDGKNGAGARVSSGVYVYTLTASHPKLSRRWQFSNKGSIQ